MTDQTEPQQPNVPIHMELTFEVPGTPEQVWHAVATGPGSSSWFLPTDLEEREGGAIVFHFSPEESSPGTITAWDPPRRIAYEEPHWADHQGTPITPLATELLVEAASGGTCVVRVVSSAFGTGADWEQEFVGQMEEGWKSAFELLRLYLARFPGQTAETFTAEVAVAGDPAAVLAAATRNAADMGSLEREGTTATVPQEGGGTTAIVLTVTDPAPGYVSVFTMPAEPPGTTTVRVSGFLFGPQAKAATATEPDRWAAWLQSLAIASA